jgi:hypothetical protein
MAATKKTGGKKRAVVKQNPDQLATRLMIIFVTLSFIFAGMAYLYYG